MKLFRKGILAKTINADAGIAYTAVMTQNNSENQLLMDGKPKRPLFCGRNHYRNFADSQSRCI